VGRDDDDNEPRYGEDVEWLEDDNDQEFVDDDDAKKEDGDDDEKLEEDDDDVKEEDDGDEYSLTFQPSNVPWVLFRLFFFACCFFALDFWFMILRLTPSLLRFAVCLLYIIYGEVRSSELDVKESI
jgi:hypothetical protein